MNTKIRILLAEDDENLGPLLREYLLAKNYETDLVVDGEKAFKSFQRNLYDLCILDVMMPIKDGFAVAKEIRAINKDIPIMFLTAKSLKDDILLGFKLGADDYITKPFNMEELLFRIEAILRRTKADSKFSGQTIYKLGKYVFDFQKQSLSADDNTHKLTRTSQVIMR